MNNTEKHELEDNEKQELRKRIKKAKAIYDLLEKEAARELTGGGDAERFIVLTFIHTETLVKHSNTLTNLTRWLIGLTVGLFVSTLGHIFITLNNIYGWL